MKKFLVGFVLSMFISICYGQANLILAKNGKTDYVLVIGDNGSSAERNAARQLQHYLQKISGTSFELVAETALAQRSRQHKIYVGRSKALLNSVNAGELKKLGGEGILIKTIGNDLFLVGGGSRGTLYAVFDFLEFNVGCKWLTAEAEIIPFKATLALKPVNRVFVPSFGYRSHYVPGAGKDAKFATILRYNGDKHPLTAEWGGKTSILGFAHTFGGIMPPIKYFKKYPEWYSDPKNGNLPAKASSNIPGAQSNQLCLTNKAMQLEFLKNTLNWISNHPDVDIISISQNDNKNYCRCSACMEVIEAEGSAAGPLLRFVNRIAEGVSENYPGKRILTLAYWYSITPPKLTKPRPNVMIWFAPIEADFGHALETAYNKKTNTQLLNWTAISSKNFYWGYNANFSNYLLPYPSLHHLKQDLLYLKKNKFQGVFIEDGALKSGIGYFKDMQTYVAGHLLWDPEADYNQLVRTFMLGYYGSAGDELLAYYMLLEEAFLAKKTKLTAYNPDYRFITPEVMKKADVLFNKALAAVKHDKILLKRVRKEKIIHDYTRLFLQKQHKTTAKNADFSNFFGSLPAYGISSVEISKYSKAVLDNQSKSVK